jgi:hypothetical protein
MTTADLTSLLRRTAVALAYALAAVALVALLAAGQRSSQAFAEDINRGLAGAQRHYQQRHDEQR